MYSLLYFTIKLFTNTSNRKCFNTFIPITHYYTSQEDTFRSNCLQILVIENVLTLSSLCTHYYTSQEDTFRSNCLQILVIENVLTLSSLLLITILHRKILSDQIVYKY